jgi:hypothetical protein
MFIYFKHFYPVWVMCVFIYIYAIIGTIAPENVNVNSLV